MPVQVPITHCSLQRAPTRKPTAILERSFQSRPSLLKLTNPRLKLSNPIRRRSEAQDPMAYRFAGVLGLEPAALENKNANLRVEEKMKRKIASNFCLFFLAGFLLAAASASAQTIAYRQTNLASDVNTQGFANQLN